MHIKRALAVLVISTASFSAHGAVSHNPDNGHFYELISFTDSWRLNWDEAKIFAENSTYNGSHGYLATLTSKEEDDFVWNLGAEGAFLGAYDNSTYNNGIWTHNEWKWVTGETFSHSNWLSGEPNHWQDGSDATPNNEDYLMYWWAPNADVKRWNDTNLNASWMDGSTLKYSTRGFVVEYDSSAGAADSIASVPVPPTLWLFATGLAFLLRAKKGNGIIA